MEKKGGDPNNSRKNMQALAYTTIPAFTTSNVSGTIDRPDSSCTGAMFTAQRMDAMLMNSELFAMCRPTQILWQGSSV